MAIDRTFIDKYDSFIFTVRKILYYGDTSAFIQPTDPKHDRWRFINFFGFDSNHEFYDTKFDTFDFDNDDGLKDEFANIFCYKSTNIPQLGDMCNLFRFLSEKPQTADKLSNSRSLKNINRRLSKNEELVQSGSVISYGKAKRTYCKNVDIADEIENREKLVEALDFAIKKNNYSAFASTYKKLLVCRDNLKNKRADVEIDHQMFHPILDEIHIWELVSAISEKRKINIKYCNNFIDATEFVELCDLIPLKIVYDTIYGRTYLFCVNNDKIQTLRVDIIFSVDLADSFDENSFLNNLSVLNEALKTAWSVSIDNDNIYHTVIRFSNTPAIKSRVKNEGRHGCITREDKDNFYFEIDVNDYSEMVSWILTYGSSCTVLEPKGLVDKMIEHLEEMAK